ncbi:MAG: TlpA family protein disulfide reductase [Caulobacteraceae bacterium]
MSKPVLGRGLALAIAIAVLIGVAAILYVIFGAIFKPADSGNLQMIAQAAAKADTRPVPQDDKDKLNKLEIPPVGTVYPPTLFVDANGQPMHMTAFKGHPVVLNLWATWCAPCVREMPTLAKLQTDYAAEGLTVVAVSMDNSAQSDTAKAFIAGHAPLKFYQDAKYGFLSDLKPHLQGFPTTVLFDRHGVERAVLSGDADWSSPEAKAVTDKLIAM